MKIPRPLQIAAGGEGVYYINNLLTRTFMVKNSASATVPTYDRVNDPHGNTDSLTYEQLVFQTVRDLKDPNTVTALRLWTGTVVVKTDYSPRTAIDADCFEYTA